jgi:hypothetical protein
MATQPSDPIVIANDGPVITSTNYWDSPFAARGFCFLSINAGCVRLLVPKVHHDLVSEMLSAQQIVLTLDERQSAHILFDDHTDTPFLISLDVGQRDRTWRPQDEGKEGPFAIYRAVGDRIDVTCWLRRGVPPTTPLGRT